MPSEKIYPAPADVVDRAHLNAGQYRAMYRQSIENPERFWAGQATELIHWFQPWDKVMDVDFHAAKINWFVGAKLNACYNCVDRHLATRGGQVAILWEGDDVDVD